MRAAALFARMNGWHLAKPPPLVPEEVPVHKPKTKPLLLIDEERQALASLNELTLKNDIANQTYIEEDLINYHSQMADLAFIANVAHPQDRRVQPPSPAIHLPEDPESEPATLDAPPAPESPIPTVQPLESPTHPLESQPDSFPNSPMGKNFNLLPILERTRLACNVLRPPEHRPPASVPSQRLFKNP